MSKMYRVYEERLSAGHVVCWSDSFGKCVLKRRKNGMQAMQGGTLRG